MDVRAVAPFVKAGDGYVICLETPTCVFTSKNDEAVIFASGMVHGEVHEMCAQVDYAFQRALTHRQRVCTVVETQRKSFRFPDRALRCVLRHLRKYETHIANIYFVDLPFLLRQGIKLAFPFLDKALRDRIRMTRVAELHNIMQAVPSHLGGPVVFDANAYLHWRARMEGCSIDGVQARRFDKEALRTANAALAAQVRALTRPVDAALFVGEGKKRGEGGLLGSVRWKAKNFALFDTELTYGDATSHSVVQLCSACKWLIVEDTIVLQTSHREYMLRIWEKERFLRSLTEAHGTVQYSSSS